MFDVVLFVVVWGLFGFKMAALPIVFAIVFACNLLGVLLLRVLAAAMHWRLR